MREEVSSRVHASIVGAAAKRPPACGAGRGSRIAQERGTERGTGTAVRKDHLPPQLGVNLAVPAHPGVLRVPLLERGQMLGCHASCAVIEGPPSASCGAGHRLALEPAMTSRRQLSMLSRLVF